MPLRGMESRFLSEPQPVDKLRSAGWTLPSNIASDYQLKVYDTRLEPRWLQGLADELGVAPLRTYVVGGDFLTSPHLEDGPALHPGRLRRWGPSGAEPYHVLIPPRPHLATWLQRCHQQLSAEACGTRFSVCCVVPRDSCTGPIDTHLLRRLVPQATPLFDDPKVHLSASLVGERPPLIRVPAHNEERVLPPQQWEPAFLPRGKVLLLLHFHHADGPRPTPSGRWIRGALPDPGPSALELLRLELVLPPATRQQAAERAARAAFTKLATAMGLPLPPPHQLRQIQVMNGGVVGILGVPRLQATEWLRGSGCGGLYLRPFWTPSTSKEVSRDAFSLLWARGRAEVGSRLWEAVKDSTGVVGLLLSGRDVAIRVTPAANIQDLQLQLQFVAGDQQAALRHAIQVQRWWRLGPLSEAEMWHVNDMVAATGLKPLRGEVRIGAVGPFRRFAYFSAVGSPSRFSLDDGSWGASEARLQPSNPPPRRPTPANASLRSPFAGPALSPQSTWGGSRQSAPPPAASQTTPSASATPLSTTPSPSATGGSRAKPRTRIVVAPADSRPTSVAIPVSPPAVAPPPTSDSRSRRRHASPPAPSTVQGDRLDRLMAQMEELCRQNAALLQEIGHLRWENVDLRRQLAEACRSHQHQPYAAPLTPPRPPAPHQGTPSSPVNDFAMAGTEDAQSSGSPDPKRVRALEPTSSS